MSLLFSKQVGNTRYEVRSAGKSLRLYSNGVFHSQWHPDRIVDGSLWDLFLFPVFMQRRPESLRNPKVITSGKDYSALVLGVGGGRAIHQLVGLVPQCQVCGVDLDATHLQLAKRFFGLTQSNVNLLKADARAWVKRTRGRKYDYIIDDLFCESADKPGQAQRAIQASASWLGNLMGLLKTDGLLVVNCESFAQLREAGRELREKNSQVHIYALSRPGYYNAIAVISPHRISCGASSAKLAAQINGAGLCTPSVRGKVLAFDLKKVI